MFKFVPFCVILTKLDPKSDTTDVNSECVNATGNTRNVRFGPKVGQDWSEMGQI